MFWLGFAIGFCACLMLATILAVKAATGRERRKEAANDMVGRANQILESSMIWAEMGDHDTAKEMFLEGLKLSIDAQRLKNKDL